MNPELKFLRLSDSGLMKRKVVRDDIQTEPLACTTIYAKAIYNLQVG